jgi:spermidine synthase
MNPWELLGKTETPAGDEMTLMLRSGEYVILASGKALMSSRMHGSEEAMASLGCAEARLLPSPVVLVGGLGMGFTLRATLDLLPRNATVVLAELVAGVVDWNRGPLGPLAQHPLRDPRVHVEIDDVNAVLRASRGRFDAVLLDIDNGPDAFTTEGNDWLYNDGGLATIRASLRGRGTVAIWSAWEDRKFEQRMRWAGFEVQTQKVRARLSKGGPRHVIFCGRMAADAPEPGSRRSRLEAARRLAAQ